MTKRGGWCPECEQEGDDPRHTRRTILCSKHHSRRYRSTEEGKAATRRSYTSEQAKANARAAFKRYYNSEHGKQKIRERDAQRSPFVKVVLKGEDHA